MSNRTVLFLLLFVVIFCLSGNGVHAFGAGNIPSFSYLEGKAFRHGDIEDAIEKLMKVGSGSGFLGGLLSKGHKFSPLDVKRIYFGNWLRDYSQAVDIAGLKKMQLQSIINLCIALGFLAHGYATHEFEVTIERLGAYLPTEHIDNPKGYGEGEDARKYDPRLRGPVDPRELEIDPDTGMKNYIANERGHWDTSKALVRRTLEQCIHLGRAHRSNNRKQDEYEALRLLGQALHTLEDFPAHSNFCELALVSMGHRDVFVHVGDNVRVRVPHGYAHAGAMVAPLVTGTFGGSDFIHSLIGEATDKISGASVSDLNHAVEKARSQGGGGTRGLGSNPSDGLRGLLSTYPIGGSEMTREMESIDRIRAGPSQGGKKPEDMTPQELHAVLWQVLTFRDSVMKKIEITIDKIPGLNALLGKITDSVSVFVLTTLEPFLKPILSTATTGLHSASTEVISNHEQYQVFNDPSASDPTHSFLSKDHFNLILNEPAGNISRIIVIYTVNLIVKAWDDPAMNVNNVTNDILQCLFHPEFHNTNSQVQREMLQFMHTWVNELGHKKHEIINCLTRNAVRDHKNIRRGGDGGPAPAEGTYAHNQALQAQQSLLGSIPGGSFFNNSPGTRRDVPGGAQQFSAPGPGAPQAPFSSPPLQQQQSFGPPPGPPPPGPLGPPGGNYPQGGFEAPYSSPKPPSVPGPAFPGTQSYSNPSFGESGGHGGHFGHQAPYSPPTGMGGFAAPPGPPGGFSPPSGFSTGPPGPHGGFGPPSNAPPGGFGPPGNAPPGGFGPPGGAPPGGFGPPTGPPPGDFGPSYGGAGPGFPGGPPYGQQPPQFPNAPGQYPPSDGSYQYRQ